MSGARSVGPVVQRLRRVEPEFVQLFSPLFLNKEFNTHDTDMIKRASEPTFPINPLFSSRHGSPSSTCYRRWGGPSWTRSRARFKKSWSSRRCACYRLLAMRTTLTFARYMKDPILHTKSGLLSVVVPMQHEFCSLLGVIQSVFVASNIFR